MKLLSIFSLLLVLHSVNAQSPTCTAVPVSLQASPPPNGCEGDVLSFFVNSNQASLPGTFTWSSSNGSLPAGMNAITTIPFNSIDPFFYASNGIYSVVYTDPAGCTSTATVMAQVHQLPQPAINEIQHCDGIHLIAYDQLNTGSPNTFQWLEAGTSTDSIIYNGSGGMGSNQTVTITNSWGCSATTFTGELFPDPAKVILKGKSKWLPGTSFRLTSTVNYPVSVYKWYKNGNLIPNAASYYLLISDTGLYKVKVKTTDGCYRVAQRKIILGTPRLGDINETELMVSELKIYPVPATDEINITGAGDETLLLFDQVGKMIREIKGEKDLMRISVADLSPGIYFLKAGDESARFIINR